jgi:type IV pilus assembly protein PilQ
VLDTQTPQVLIESKIVEVNEGYAKEIGLSQGFNFGYDPVGSVTNADPSTVGAAGSAGTDFGPGFSFSSAPASDSDAVRSVFGLAIGRFGRLTNLNFTLQLLESESKAKVLSSPKVVTQNKKKAILKAKRTEVYRTVTGVADAQEIDFDSSEVNLSLTVTPQVTNEGSISLEIEVVKEDFGTTNFVGGPPNITGSEVQSNVLVENGSTIVLGGIYEYASRETHSGVPFLKDIPLIGWLFRTPYAPQTTKREVIIFITPRIINQEEAGLVDQV